MREAISQFFMSIIKTLGLFNRVINTAGQKASAKSTHTHTHTHTRATR